MSIGAAYCPHCGNKIEPGTVFCGKCGGKIEAQTPGAQVTATPGATFCPHCGTRIGLGSAFCPNCGSRIGLGAGPVPAQTYPSYSSPPSRKDPAIAGVMAFFIWGLGPLYNGQTAKGMLFIILQIVLIVLSILFFFIGIIGFALAIFSAWDAYNTSKKINMGVQVGSGLSYIPP